MIMGSEMVKIAFEKVGIIKDRMKAAKNRQKIMQKLEENLLSLMSKIKCFQRSLSKNTLCFGRKGKVAQIYIKS